MDISEQKSLFGDKVKTAYAVVFALLAVFSYILLIRIDIKALSELKAFRTRAEQTLSVLKLLSDYKSYIKEFDEKFVSNKDTNWLIGTITDLAKKKSIVLDLVKPVSEENLYGYNIISILVEGKAAYHQIGDFVADIEDNEKFLIIREFTVKAEEDSSFGDFGMPGGGEAFPGGMPGMGGQMPSMMPMGPMGSNAGFPGSGAAGSGGGDRMPFKEERVTVFKLVVASMGMEK